MLDDLLLFLIIFICSQILISLIRKGKRLRPFYGILMRLAYIGVAIHEIAHYLASLMVGIKPDNIEIKWKFENTNIVAPHGKIQKYKPCSFLQAFLIVFAPLYFSTWLAIGLFTITAYSDFHPILRVITGILLVSVIIGASPSSGDMSTLYKSITWDLTHTLYQFFIVIISILILWSILFATKWLFFLDIFYYLSIAVIYWSIKLSFMAIGKVIFIIRSKNIYKPHKLNGKRLTRHRYKPQKAHKLGIKEAPW